MPGSISDSYHGPADPCPSCSVDRHGERRPPDALCGVCFGTGWMPDDYVCPPGKHSWITEKTSGPIDPAEYGAWCQVCGVEKIDEAA